MKAIILAAGEGKRMRPLTLETPKPMVEILGKPLLHHIVDALPDVITELIFVVGYKAEQIKAYFGSEFEGRKVTYVRQDKPLGTGHALLLCKDLIGPTEKFLFMIGDDLHSPESIKRLVKLDLGMLVHEHPNPKEFGVVEVNGKGEVISFEEKPDVPKSNLVSPAVFVLDGRIFKYPMSLHEKGEYFAVDQINQMMKEHKFIVEHSSFWHPIGYPHDIDAAEALLDAKRISVPARKKIPLIILAGGHGTRLTGEQRPKMLIDIAGKSMLEHQLENALQQGFTNIRLSLGFKADEIIQWLKSSAYKEVDYVVEKLPLNTGGALKFASKNLDVPFLAINGDDLADVNYAGLVRHSSGRYNVISGTEVGQAHEYGLIECDPFKRICSFREKDEDARVGIVSIGHYYLLPDIFEATPRIFSLEHFLFPRLAATGKLVLHQHTGNYWFGCGTPEVLDRTRAYFLKHG